MNVFGWAARVAVVSNASEQESVIFENAKQLHVCVHTNMKALICSLSKFRRLWVSWPSSKCAATQGPSSSKTCIHHPFSWCSAHICTCTSAKNNPRAHAIFWKFNLMPSKPTIPPIHHLVSRCEVLKLAIVTGSSFRTSHRVFTSIYVFPLTLDLSVIINNIQQIFERPQPPSPHSSLAHVNRSIGYHRPTTPPL